MRDVHSPQMPNTRDNAPNVPPPKHDENYWWDRFDQWSDAMGLPRIPRGPVSAPAEVPDLRSPELRSTLNEARALILRAWSLDVAHDLNDTELSHLRSAWSELELISQDSA